MRFAVIYDDLRGDAARRCVRWLHTPEPAGTAAKTSGDADAAAAARSQHGAPPGCCTTWRRCRAMSGRSSATSAPRKRSSRLPMPVVRSRRGRHAARRAVHRSVERADPHRARRNGRVGDRRRRGRRVAARATRLLTLRRLRGELSQPVRDGAGRSRGRGPRRSCRRATFRGDFQMHSTWSDGGERIEAMAQACMALGHTCMGVTDHSYGLPIARGMSMDGRGAAASRDRSAEQAARRRLPGVQGDRGEHPRRRRARSAARGARACSSSSSRRRIRCCARITIRRRGCSARSRSRASRFSAIRRGRMYNSRCRRRRRLAARLRRSREAARRDRDRRQLAPAGPRLRAGAPGARRRLPVRARQRRALDRRAAVHRLLDRACAARRHSGRPRHQLLERRRAGGVDGWRGRTGYPGGVLEGSVASAFLASPGNIATAADDSGAIR